MNNTLIAQERNVFRKSVLHQLRKEGNIPAVVYGKHEESKAIAVKKTDLLKIISDIGRNGIFSLKVNGKPQDVVLEDYQSNPINNDILHADFLHVNMSTELHAKVYVTLTGTAKGVEEGGILQQSLHELNITAKPKDIPETIEVDVSQLEIHHSIKVASIREKYPNITIKHEDEEVIATIIPSTIEDTNTDEQQSSIIEGVQASPQS
jgi:large subunit ribosomal protein L25